MEISIDEFLYKYVMNNNPQIKEQDILNYKAINPYDLLIEYKDGSKAVFDTFANNWKYIEYENEELTEEEELYEFKTMLRKMMKRKFINQNDLAKRVGVSQSMISNYMRGYSIPDALMLKKLARALECSTDDFYYKHY